MEDLSSNVLFAQFNQSGVSINIGTTTGYALYTIDDLNQVRKIYENCIGDNAVLHVERYYATLLHAVVYQKTPYKLNVYYIGLGELVCDVHCSGIIQSVKMTKEYLAICLTNRIEIHHLQGDQMKRHHAIENIPTNSRGTMDIATIPNSKSCVGNSSVCDETSCALLVYPHCEFKGRIAVFDMKLLSVLVNINAHDSRIAALRFSADGRKVATASVKGTVIRVFHTQSGAKLFEFVRGFQRSVMISALTFSDDSIYLASTSNTSTVHVFKLDQEVLKHSIDRPSASPTGSTGNLATESKSWFNFFSSAAMNYLPASMSQVLTCSKSFAVARLPNDHLTSDVAMPIIDGLQNLFVLTTYGGLFCYLVSASGGELTLARSCMAEHDAICDVFSSEKDCVNPEPDDSEQVDLSVSLRADDFLSDPPSCHRT